MIDAQQGKSTLRKHSSERSQHNVRERNRDPCLRTDIVLSDLSSNDENTDEEVNEAHDGGRVNEREGHSDTEPPIANVTSEFEHFWTSSTLDLPMDLYFASIGTEMDVSVA